VFFKRAPRYGGVLGSRDIAPHILNLCTRWAQGILNQRKL